MMPPLRTRILELINEKPGLTDREITDTLLGREVHQSHVNQTCRSLEAGGHLRREPRVDGKLGNFPSAFPAAESMMLVSKEGSAEHMSEDEVKAHLKNWLEACGWVTEIAWGKARGTDIVARRGGSTWLIEAKGCGSRPEMRVNYFIGMLGELLQRMSIEDARYSIALPNIPQFRRLWDRLPALARSRTGISALFVGPDGCVEHLLNEDRGD